MKAEIVRKQFGATSTIGELLIDGEVICLILEDKVRDKNKNGDNEEGKIYGETAIPYGKYKIVLEQNGTIHQSYLKKDWNKLGFKGFGSIYQGMLMVTGIKGYSRVHIHIGNEIKHTLGCPLTGTSIGSSTDPYTVKGSTAAYVKLYKKVIDYLLSNGNIPLEVK